MKPSAAATTYLTSCQREGTDCALELLNALNQNEREALLDRRAHPLTDTDLICIADALRSKHSLRVLNIEENSFGLTGVSAIVDAVVANPGCLRELRLGKNRLKDPSAVAIGNALSLNGAGLKVLDMSENFITKLGIASLCQALSSKYCDLVELSLHNNSLESDAAIPLAQALRQTTKLKHLHLGYNSLRDTGAVQISRSLPIAASLATLDLTANRIGPQGGHEIAKALLSPKCTLQRLNLRHNNFDDETFEAFGDVLIKNTSLTQLFLGFMKPSRDTAAHVVSTLRYNHTLVLFDMYGWALDAIEASTLMEAVLSTNHTLRAVVTDACHSIMHHVDEFNQSREDNGLHRVYIGPEDRHAYQAAAAAKAKQSTARADGTPEPAAPTSRSASNAVVSHRRTASAASRTSAAATPTERGVHINGTSDVDRMLSDFDDVHMDNELRRRLVLVLSQMQTKLDTVRSYHQQQIVALEERIRSLESRPCQHTCTGAWQGGAAALTFVSGKPPSRTASPAIRPGAAAAPQTASSSVAEANPRSHSPPPAYIVPHSRPTASPSGKPLFFSTNATAATVTPPSETVLDVTQRPSSPSAAGRATSPARGPQSRAVDVVPPPGPNTRPMSPFDRAVSSRTSNAPAAVSTPPRRTEAAPAAGVGVPPLAVGGRGPMNGRPHGAAGPARSSSVPAVVTIQPTTLSSLASPSKGSAYRSGSAAPASTTTVTPLYVPTTSHSNIAAPPAEPSPVVERSPANPHLQESLHVAKSTVLEASPVQQGRLARKTPRAY